MEPPHALEMATDVSEYPGQWVVLCHDRVVAHDKDLKNLHDAIKKCKQTPTVMKVPTDETHIF